MSMSLNFEPKFWYMGFAVGKYGEATPEAKLDIPYFAVTDDGNSYRINTVEGQTLDELRSKIREYHLKRRNGYGERIAARRLEYLRGEIEAEQISYSEISELESLADYIADDDVQLLQWANVQEGSR